MFFHKTTSLIVKECITAICNYTFRNNRCKTQETVLYVMLRREFGRAFAQVFQDLKYRRERCLCHALNMSFCQQASKEIEQYSFLTTVSKRNVPLLILFVTCLFYNNFLVFGITFYRDKHTHLIQYRR